MTAIKMKDSILESLGLLWYLVRLSPIALLPVLWRLLWLSDEVTTAFHRDFPGVVKFGPAEIHANVTYVLETATPVLEFNKNYELDILFEIHYVFLYALWKVFTPILVVILFLRLSGNQLRMSCAIGFAGYFLLRYVFTVATAVAVFAISLMLYYGLFHAYWSFVGYGKVCNRILWTQVCRHVMFGVWTFIAEILGGTTAFFIGIPLFRAICFLMDRSLGHFLLVKAKETEAGKNWMLEMSWFWLLESQIFVGTLSRLQMTKIEPSIVAIALLYQGALEFIWRSTFRWRLRMAKTYGRKVHADELLSDFMDLDEEYVSQLMVATMLTDYFGIVIACGMIYINSSDIIGNNVDFFVHRGNIFENHRTLLPIVHWGVSHIAFELTLDFIAGIMENRQGYSLSVAMQPRNQLRFLLCTCLATMSSFGVSVAVQDVRLTDYSACLGKDICYCADNHGLLSGGIQELYCLRLYPHSNGYPQTPTFL